VRIPNLDLWITIVHSRYKKSKQYWHRFLVLSISKEFDDIQVECRHLSSENVFVQEGLFDRNSFFFAVGLAHVANNRFLVSFGRDNKRSFVQQVSIRIDESKTSIDESKMFAAVKRWKGSPALQFFSMFVAQDGKVSQTRMEQFVKCFLSIRYHHPGATIHLFTTHPNSFVSELQERVPFVKIVIFTLEELFRDTPAHGFASSIKCHWKEASDLVRLAMLWRWGGTWIDTDDIVIRPITALPNVLPYLEWPGVKEKVYWETHFKLIDAKWKSGGMSRNLEAGFHIQNDPLINFEPGNPFLGRWIQELVGRDKAPPCKDWGQRVPTDIFRQDPIWGSRYLTLLPQFSLLLHPAFGNATAKGPMFPRYDYRLPDNFPLYDTLVSEKEAEAYFQQMIRVQPFFAVKVKDSHYAASSADQNMGNRCIPAWIAYWTIEKVDNLVIAATK
jgi:hypothetical protein